MTKTQDYTKMMQEMMSAFPVDASAFQQAFKTQAALGEKMTKVALEAAEKSTEISSKWTKDVLAKMGEVSRAREEPSEYSKALSDFASASAEMSAEHMAAFAEVVKKVQMETVELMLAAGKDLSQDATSAAKGAAAGVPATPRKAPNASPV